MPKSIVVDTNLLLDDPGIIFKLGDNDRKIIVPLAVLSELDKHKFNPDLSYSARSAIYSILDFKSKHPDKIIFDIDVGSASSNDLRIIQSADKYKAILSTKDISMSLVAEAMGVDTQLYGVVTDGFFDPYYYISDESVFEEFKVLKTYNGLKYDEVIHYLNGFLDRDIDVEAWIFVFFEVKESIVYVYANNPLTQELIRIDNNPEYRCIDDTRFTLKTQDVYQTCAVFCMKESPNTLLCGTYGSGKSLLATAYGLAYNDKKTYISRPNLTVDRRFELGFLPGRLEDKLLPWMSGFTSSLYYLFSDTKNQKTDKDSQKVSYDYVMDQVFSKSFEMLALETLQGMSFQDGDLLLLDEIQLCSISILSVMLSRFGKGSKLIMTGDIRQVYDVIRPSESGLLKLLRVLPHKSLSYVELKNNYRSELVEIADLLQDKSF